MKYMISWFERPQGSPAEYENAKKRILEVFGQWKAPANFKIEFFVIRVGEWGGHMLMECDDDHSQILFDASRFRIRGASRHYGRGSRPRRTRGNCLARWTEKVIVAHRLGFGQTAG